MADAIDGPEQEVVAGMGAILRAGTDRIVTPDEYSKFAEIKKCESTLIVPMLILRVSILVAGTRPAEFIDITFTLRLQKL